MRYKYITPNGVYLSQTEAMIANKCSLKTIRYRTINKIDGWDRIVNNENHHCIACNEIFSSQKSKTQALYCSRQCYTLYTLYKINKNIYNDMIKSQNNSCKICLKIFNNKHYSTNANVDHCHNTGKIRGLLCQQCNRALGLFKENIDTLKNAIIYLN